LASARAGLQCAPVRRIASITLCLAAACGAEDPAPRGPRPLLDAPSPDAAPPTALLDVPDDAPTVVFLGDSIGAGLHLAEHQAFPALLQEQLAAEGLPFRLVNASESGRTSAGGAAALGWVLRSEPDVVVLGLGGNDGLRGLALEDTEAHLRAMIAGARDAGARVVLLGVRLPPNYGEYGERFDALYPRLAAELELDFVPYYMRGVGGVPELNLPDGLHPTPEGHALLARNVLPTLRAALRAAAGD